MQAQKLLIKANCYCEMKCKHFPTCAFKVVQAQQLCPVQNWFEHLDWIEIKDECFICFEQNMYYTQLSRHLMQSWISFHIISHFFANLQCLIIMCCHHNDNKNLNICNFFLKNQCLHNVITTVGANWLVKPEGKLYNCLQQQYWVFNYCLFFTRFLIW